MTNQFASAVAAQTQKSVKKANQTTTTNGAKAFKSTLDANVDLFGKAGAARGQDLSGLFDKALREEPELALRNLLFIRDVRGGAGERDTFRNLMKRVADVKPAYLLETSFLEKTAEVGRWDDLLTLFTPVVDARIRDKISALYKQALLDGNGLAAKWAPRKGEVAARLRASFGWTPKFYRKTLVNLTTVVETKMCSKEWDGINFNHVPSKAMTIYSKAFQRNALESFNKYKESLANGTAKVNANAVFPHDVARALWSDGSRVNDVVFESQWKSLPDYVSSEANILPMIDISGSMTCEVGGTKNLTCMDVSISLGLYLAERVKGAYNGMYLTFSGSPTLANVNHIPTLRERLDFVRRHNVGYNTNIEAAFHEILRVAVANKVPQEDMPTHLVIFSDMQFDQAQQNAYSWNEKPKNKTAQKMAKDAFEQAGYKLPKIIYWNLHSHDNVPVKFDTSGTALVSGFSPSIMKPILATKFDEAVVLTPRELMLEAILNERYDIGFKSKKAA